jgi:Acyl-coenzyme A:6-aminopenicillanic acid acyl-transferase
MGWGGRSVVGLVLVTAGLAGCSGPDHALVAAPGSAAVSTPALAPTTPAAPLTPTEQRTLASLRVLDRDHPLYEMTYAGALPPILSAGGAPDPAATTGPSGLRKPFGCTVFLAGDPARPVVGRNFDWDPNPAFVLHTDPPGGTATTSIVDISYLGYDRAHLADLDTPAGRRALLRAPLLPFDGMNEHGLAVGMAAEETAVATRRPGRALVGSVRIMRLVLEQARTVGQAIAVLGAYDLDFDGGPPLHYFVADATGSSAIVEFVGGRFTVIPRGDQPWQVMVNFQQATSTEASRRADRRWRTATDRLTAARGRLDPHQVLGLLADVRQGHTQWSVAYDLKGRRAFVVVDQDYRTVRHFHVG